MSAVHDLDADARRGPWWPTTSTPALAVGGVRRTTSIVAQLPRATGDRLRFSLGGRDVLLGRDGPRTTDHQSVDLALDARTRRVEAVTSAPRRPLDVLCGRTVGPGFRREIAAVPGLRPAGTLLHSLLDQLPGAAFLVGYTAMADDPPSTDSPAARARFAGRVDLCAGYTATGTIGTWIGQLGHSPVPRGPRAPDLRVPDPAGWHELPPVVPLSFRRVRRVDVGPPDDDGTVGVDAMFRDTNVARDGVESVLHEYALQVRVDVRRRVVLQVEAQPRVLPWQECPAAAASVARVAGMPVADLRGRVSAEFTGPATCTHLNEALRVLADVDHLLGVAAAPEPLA